MTPVKGRVGPLPASLFASAPPSDVDAELQAACAEIAAVRRALGIPAGSTASTVAVLQARLAGSGGAGHR